MESQGQSVPQQSVPGIAANKPTAPDVVSQLKSPTDNVEVKISPSKHIEDFEEVKAKGNLFVQKVSTF